MTAGEVTAVIVAYNSARHMQGLAEALGSGSLAPTRMLVIDNDSTDDTLQRAREAGFEVHEMGRNAGFGGACNAALRLVDTELVLICNPDVRPAVDALAELVEALDGDPGAAVAGAPERSLRARRFSRVSGNLWSFFPGRLQRPLMRFAPDVPVADRGYPAVDFVVGAFMLCRVAPLRSVGGFDECFFLYCEEEDLCRRLGARGWRTRFAPAASIGHEDRASSEGVAHSQMASFYFHSLYRYYRKYHSRPYAEAARLILAGCVLGDRAYRALLGREQAYGPGTAAAPFRDIGRLRRELG